MTSGILMSGNEIIIAPRGIISRIREIRVHNEPKIAAVPGEIVTVLLSTKEHIDRGDVIINADSTRHLVKKMTAQIVLLRNNPLRCITQDSMRYEASFFFHTCQVTCKITKLISTVDKKTANIITEAPRTLRKLECALVVIEPTQPLFIDTFAMNTLPGKLGRFGFSDSKILCGAGIVKSVDE